MAIPPTAPVERSPGALASAAQTALYPRFRFMGSKYRLAPALIQIFDDLPAGPALDAFSGSGVVSYALKASGRATVANDHLVFTSTIAKALVSNDDQRLCPEEIDAICSESLDGRNFITETFDGLYFPRCDHEFLDSAWSHLDRFDSPKKELGLGALCLAAAWKQPRGVFTVTTPRYDDGRRQLRMSLKSLFREAVDLFNRAVFEGHAVSTASSLDVFELPRDGFSLVYLDPPYAPPRDDTCYIKRYHFLEGLATYWRGQEIMWETRTRKLKKRYTPFAYKNSAAAALDDLFGHFDGSALVVSYGSNAAIKKDEIERMLQGHRSIVDCIEIPHNYAFGNHSSAHRRRAVEYVFVAQ